ncbi:hypothetical protein VN1204_05940 [Helicobacter pylori]|nr:hypothetical protein VN1204_05940 [Helicobacter pylori]
MHATIITNIIFIIASRIFESFLTFFSFPKRIKLTPKKIINIITTSEANILPTFNGMNNFKHFLPLNVSFL